MGAFSALHNLLCCYNGPYSSHCLIGEATITVVNNFVVLMYELRVNGLPCCCVNLVTMVTKRYNLIF